ncbi:MAG: hypothetical protein RIF41_07530, partial [Polyangiaceae bacterium]
RASTRPGGPHRRWPPGRRRRGRGRLSHRPSRGCCRFYTQVSIRKLKEIHAATHPAAKLEVRRDEQLAELLRDLDAEDDDCGTTTEPAWLNSRRLATMTAMHTEPLKARVINGRLVLDAPTNLPEGAEVELAVVDGDDLDDEERAELHAAIEQGMDDLDAGRSVDAEVILAKIRARQA